MNSIDFNTLAKLPWRRRKNFIEAASNYYEQLEKEMVHS